MVGCYRPKGSESVVRAVKTMCSPREEAIRQRENGIIRLSTCECARCVLGRGRFLTAELLQYIFYHLTFTIYDRN